ncbi:hypothetical protein TNCV_2135991 [Trichonephila clavipes]|nr:hypothetical protein TNCV_2135991 [Trichonephila clavipes]
MLDRSNEMLDRSNEMLDRSNDMLDRSNDMLGRSNDMLERSNEIFVKHLGEKPSDLGDEGPILVHEWTRKKRGELLPYFRS